jgi:hypothetical protein
MLHQKIVPKAESWLLQVKRKINIWKNNFIYLFF